MDVGPCLARGAVLSASVSASSFSICAFMTGVVAIFFRCGFVIGDCRMLDFLVLVTLFFRTFLDISIELGGTTFDCSSSNSTGELVVAVP